MNPFSTDETSDDVTITLFLVDDQQRISTFSKLNSRVRNLEEKLQELKASCRLPRLVTGARGLTSPIAREGGVG